MQDQPTRLLHWTEGQGQFRDIDRSRYGDDVLTPLRPMLNEAILRGREKKLEIPNYDRYFLRAWVDVSGLHFQIRSKVCLVSCLVLSEDPATLHSRKSEAITLHPDTGGWMVEMARCLAWCWLTEIRGD